MTKHSFDPTSSGTLQENRANFRDNPCCDCKRFLWVPGPRGQYSGKIRFIEKPGVQDEGKGLPRG